MIKQAVILCGGMGTRLGALTASTPKPLLPVDGTPFLQILVQEVARSGIREFLLLAGHMADQVSAFAEEAIDFFGGTLTISVAIEKEPAGTGGALLEAVDRLAPEFLLLNGDSFLDIRVSRLWASLESEPGTVGALALRQVEDSGRYGSVLSNGSLVQRFEEKRAGAGPGLINGGVYAFRRDALLRALQPRCSLERDVLPRLASENLLQGVEADGFFIDIGLPQSFAEAQRSLMAHRRRPAVFFDRDGVLNRDHGHVGSIERFEWTEGALDAIRLVNDRGYYAFVVTNQAGIAKGKYSLSDYWALRDFIRSELAANGGQIDDERFCPFHPEGIVPAYRASSPDRKPAPGMILSLIDCWPVEIEGSVLVGDQTTERAAAEAAGIKAFHFEHGNLHDFVQGCLGEQRG